MVVHGDLLNMAARSYSCHSYRLWLSERHVPTLEVPSVVIQSFFPPLSPHTFTKGWQIRTNWRSLHKYQMGHSASSGSQYTSFVNTLYNPWSFSAASNKEGYTHQRQQIATPWGSWCCLISIGDTMLWKMWSWISLVDAPLDTSAYTWTCTCTQIHSYHTHRAGHTH